MPETRTREQRWGKCPGEQLGRSRPGRLLLYALLLLALVSCRGQEPPPPPEQPVATVNGERIDRPEFLRQLTEEAALVKGEQPLKAEQYARLKEEALGHLIEARLILQRARELLLTIGPDELEARIAEIKKDYADDSFNALFGNRGISYAAWKEALRKRMLFEKVITLDVNKKVQVTDDEVEIHYKANRRLYASERRIRALQIVVRDRDLAEKTLKRLKAGEDFDKVAREVSIGPEAAKGGDLGFFERGIMPQEIDRMVFSLPVGKVSDVVQSPYGFHIFKVLAKEEGGGRKLADARERVIADLRKLKEAEAYERWIEGLKEKAEISVNRPLPDGPVPAQPEKKGTDKPLAGDGRH
ncbi:MAG: peptidylprolyl isomerase [Syntrophales bacterium]